MKYPKTFLNLIDSLKKLPGVGFKTAERYAFELLSWSKPDLNAFSVLLENLGKDLTSCEVCGCLQEANNVCGFCHKNTQTKIICVVASMKDAFILSETNSFDGYFHVLGSLISPLEGKYIEDIDLKKLLNRIEGLEIEEVILALDSTIEGDATSLYIKEQLKNNPIKVSKLAMGLPMGSNLDHVDPGTLIQALSGRQFI